MNRPISYFKDSSLNMPPLSTLMHSGFAHLIIVYAEGGDVMIPSYKDYFINLSDIRSDDNDDTLMNIIWETKNNIDAYDRMKKCNLSFIREMQRFLYDDTMTGYDEELNNDMLHTARANHCSIPLQYYENINDS